MRAATRFIAVIVCMAVLMPQIDSMAQNSKIQAQIAKLPTGSTIELQFSNGRIVVGKLDSLAEDRVVLLLDPANSAAKSIYMIQEISEVRLALPRDKNLHDKNLKNLQVSPDSLGAVIAGETVDLMTRDGTYVKGSVFDANAEKILVDVSKCEPKDRYHGRDAILTADISVVHMKKGHSAVASIALGIAGGFGGLLLGIGAVYDTDSVAGLLVPIGGLIGGAWGGAYAGHALTGKTVTIYVDHSK